MKDHLKYANIPVGIKSCFNGKEQFQIDYWDGPHVIPKEGCIIYYRPYCLQRGSFVIGLPAVAKTIYTYIPECRIYSIVTIGL